MYFCSSFYLATQIHMYNNICAINWNLNCILATVMKYVVIFASKVLGGRRLSSSYWENLKMLFRECVLIWCLDSTFVYCSCRSFVAQVYKKLSCRWQTARRIWANAMACPANLLKTRTSPYVLITSDLVNLPNLVVLR